MELDGPIAILTLNRPAVLNALNADLLTLLEETLDAFTGDPSLRAVIITGAGERAFAAGADIGELANGLWASCRSKRAILAAWRSSSIS